MTCLFLVNFPKIRLILTVLFFHVAIHDELSDGETLEPVGFTLNSVSSIDGADSDIAANIEITSAKPSVVTASILEKVEQEVTSPKVSLTAESASVSSSQVTEQVEDELFKRQEYKDHQAKLIDMPVPAATKDERRSLELKESTESTIQLMDQSVSLLSDTTGTASMDSTNMPVLEPILNVVRFV